MHPSLLTNASDSTAAPDVQRDQVLAIYPIIDGQTVANLGTHPKAPGQPVEQPASKGEDSLIDFGGESEVKHPANDVEQMLQDTGKPAEGSLIDL